MRFVTALLCTCALSALLAAGCSDSDSILAPQTADPALNAGAPATAGVPVSVTLPFRGRYSTTFTLPTTPPPFLEFYIWGEGVATALGTSSWEGPSSVDLTQLPPVQTATSVFTAADGSQFTMSSIGFALPGPDAVYDVGFEGNFTISAGTGRFSGISGSGVYRGIASNSLAAGEISYDGTVTLPRPLVTPATN
jgi:hypothetical protein